MCYRYWLFIFATLYDYYYDIIQPWIQKWIVRIIVTIVIMILCHIPTIIMKLPKRTTTTRNDQQATASSPLVRSISLPNRPISKEYYIPTDLQLYEEEDENDDPKERMQVKKITTTNQTKQEDDYTADDITSKAQQKQEQSSEEEELKQQQQQQQQQQQLPNQIVKITKQKKNKKNEQKEQEDQHEQQQNVITKQYIFSKDATNEHPGLKKYWYPWYEIESNYFRQYTLYHHRTNDGLDGTFQLPYFQRTIIDNKNKNNKISIELKVTNQLVYPIAVYWINAIGKGEYKGIILPNHTFVQHTYLDHSWMFCRINNISTINTNNNMDDQTCIVQYIPYNIIPSVLPEAPTINYNTNTPIHQFAIIPPIISDNDNDTGTTRSTNSNYYCSIDDPIFPYPVQQYIKTPRDAAGFTLLHCYRMNYNNWNVLMKYLTKIVMNPNIIQYRQIRIANPIFYNTIWNYTYCRGLFYSIGFIEHGPYIELGNHSTPLSRGRVQDVSQLLLAIGIWHRRQLLQQQQQQVRSG